MNAPAPLLADESAPATPQQLLTLLEELHIDAPTVSHPPVFTVEEARAHRGGLTGAHTKNLFVRDKKGVMWLIVAIESQKVDLRAVAESLGHKRFSFGSAERLMKYLGLIPGAVTPFGLVNDHGGMVSLALDESLRDYEAWNFHPLTNAMTTSVRPDDMLRFFEHIDHPPRWVRLD